MLGCLTPLCAQLVGKTDASGAGQSSQFNGFGTGNSSYYLVSAGLTYTVSPTASASFNLTRSETGANGTTGSIVDDIVSVVFRKQF